MILILIMLAIKFVLALHATSLCAKAINHLIEEDLLDKAWGLEPNSRLSCQAIVGGQDLVVEIPKYSINMAKEGHR
jgi:hypothetical protein